MHSLPVNGISHRWPPGQHFRPSLQILSEGQHSPPMHGADKVQQNLLSSQIRDSKQQTMSMRANISSSVQHFLVTGLYLTFGQHLFSTQRQSLPQHSVGHARSLGQHLLPMHASSGGQQHETPSLVLQH